MIRIVDPLGLQVAWVSPALAGGIVGYYARSSMEDAWTEVLACSLMAGREAGSALLLRDARSGQMEPAPGIDSGWTFASRDPTQATVSGRINDHDVSVSLQCADGELHIEIAPGNGLVPLPEAGLRLHLGAAVGQFDAASSGGELSFQGGTLDHLSLVHPSRLACQVTTVANGDHQVDLVPDPAVITSNAARSVSITLAPLPKRG